MKVKLNKKREEGITLVALIITIIILVILAAVSISAVYKSRVVDYAINGAIGYTDESIRENEIMSGTESLIDSTIKKIEDILGGKTKEPPAENKPLVTTLTEIQGSKVEAKDRLGNLITIPAGFKYKEGEIVEKGIVIEDGDGNQFVWVPVSNTNHDGTNKIKRENGTEVEITLGRYQFDTGTGAVKKGAGEYLYAVNYASEAALTVNGSDYKELKDYRESNGKNDLTGTNTTAKNLKGFIDSTNANHGYYIARYEASYGSGYDNTKENPLENAKPLSKVSTANSEDSMNYTAGTLWNFVNEPDAAQVCRNMYSGNVNSDLVNSYAWDTAIVFIQEMEENDYSIKKDANSELRDTGTKGDKVCNISDMSGNLDEWTTEFSTHTYDSHAYPCVARGGFYGSGAGGDTRKRNLGRTMDSDIYYGFRCLLYV